MRTLRHSIGIVSWLLRKRATYDIFICHNWDYHPDYLMLVELLYTIRGCTWRNHANYRLDSFSIDEDISSERISSIVREQIASSHCLIVISDMYRENSRWIQKEIDIALGLKKPIMALKSRWLLDIPRQVKNSADAVVGWNMKEIQAAAAKLCATVA